ncbi:peptidylprolyl isomerase [Flavobacterium sp.]|uniref:peptidylprolyl isomerase n=1 Tax=Flavobacterium sp. TaxID=239 RepID=UPI00261AA495|nr:peptidylprolyl isomerase [Flavobacterium sp.]
MKIKWFFICLFILSITSGFAQNITKEVLFTVDGEPFYTDEFARVYKKNIDLVKDESQKDLNQYLDLYIGYKLKIIKANKLGLQNGTAYQNELKSYRSQLAKNYLTDPKVTKELVDQAYERSKFEIKAAHILISCDENASPADTLKSYNKILEIKNRISKGEDFGKLAKELSEDPSAKENAGDLGFFSVFRMVYPFESGAYKTAVGKVSEPIRTRFGYHIIKVLEKRPNRGEVNVAHIMIAKPGTKEGDTKAKDKITEIYQKLQQGEKFETLAEMFSEDQSTAKKGGVLNKFASGDLTSEEFEDVAFSLSTSNPVSEPFETDFGWHIVKFLQKFPMKPFEEVKSDLESRIKKDERSRKITTSLVDKLSKKYSPKTDQKVYKSLEKVFDDSYYKGEWKQPADTKPFEKTLYTVADQKFTAFDFIQFVDKRQKLAPDVKPISKLIENLYQTFTTEKLQEYYNNNLEKEFPEFADIMTEYRDGLLLFDLMEKEIWQKAKTDTIGLQNFYNSNKSAYRWKKRFEGIIASSVTKDLVTKTKKALKNKTAIADIKKELNKDGKSVMITEGTFDENSDAYPATLAWKEGLSEVLQKGDYYYLVEIKKILPAADKIFEEAKGKIINDYQQYLESNWVTNLKKDFKIDVNQAAFERVKAALK